MMMKVTRGQQQQGKSDTASESVYDYEEGNSKTDNSSPPPRRFGVVLQPHIAETIAEANEHDDRTRNTKLTQALNTILAGSENDNSKQKQVFLGIQGM